MAQDWRAFFKFDPIPPLQKCLDPPFQYSNISRALNYYREKQVSTGAWEFYILKGKSHLYLNEWLSLVLCRSIKRFFESN